MLEIMQLEDAEERLRALIYMRQFQNRLSELRNDVKTVVDACDDVKISLELKKLLKIILTLGNRMNEGSNRGFTLDSLLKLSDAKAFDKKTSILHFLVQVRRQSIDGSSIMFESCPAPLPHIPSPIWSPGD